MIMLGLCSNMPILRTIQLFIILASGGSNNEAATTNGKCGYTATVIGDGGKHSCANAATEIGEVMDCFGYAMNDDWCSFSFTNQNTPPDLEKCDGDSIFLHDEPDTQKQRGFGEGYPDAVKQWKDWALKNNAKLKIFREKGNDFIQIPNRVFSQ